MPSAVVVMVLLLALTLDAAATFLAQRRLADTCAAAANDAATAGLRRADLYARSTGAEVVDPDRAAGLARRRVAPLEEEWGAAVAVRVEAAGPAVGLSLEAKVPTPVAPRRPKVTATCRAVALRR